MKIIVNADDFGYSKGVNLGIIEAYRNGLVRSTTIMPPMPGYEHAVELAQKNPGLKVGVHLTLSTGKSLCETHKTITDSNGNFLNLKDIERKANAGELNLAEVEAEYEAQIQKVVSSGIKPSHFDSHHHVHNLPGIVGVFLKLARKYNVNVRLYNKGLLVGDYIGIKAAKAFDDTFFGEGVSCDNLKSVIGARSDTSLEIMCHPAYVDQALYAGSSYNIKRALELEVLTSDEMKKYVVTNGHTLCSFADL